MHTGEISFCDKTAFNIKSDDTKKYILDRLERTYGIKIIQKHFEKFHPHAVKQLKANPHMVCVRSNGNPYFLYLMRYNFSQYCVFIDKKVQHGYFLPRMIIMPVHFRDDLFDDTLFEGEMTKAKDGKWFYLVNDLIAWKGRHLLDVNLPKRMNLLYTTLKEDYFYDVYDPFRVCVKRHFRYDELENISTYLADLPYTSRGLYFRPLFLRFKDILYNFDDTLIKKVERFKCNGDKSFMMREDIHPPSPQAPPPPPPVQLPSAQVEEGTTPAPESKTCSQTMYWVRKTAQPDIYDMFDDHGKNVGVACIPSMKISKKMRDLMQEKNLVDKVKIPFTFSERFQKWVPDVVAM